MNKYLVQISNQNFIIEGENALNTLTNLEEIFCTANDYNFEYEPRWRKTETIDRDILKQNILIMKINN